MRGKRGHDRRSVRIDMETSAGGTTIKEGTGSSLNALSTSYIIYIYHIHHRDP